MEIRKQSDRESICSFLKNFPSDFYSTFRASNVDFLPLCWNNAEHFTHSAFEPQFLSISTQKIVAIVNSELLTTALNVIIILPDYADEMEARMKIVLDSRRFARFFPEFFIIRVSLKAIPHGFAIFSEAAMRRSSNSLS